NQCLAGSADGVGLLWDLDQLKNKPLQLQESHRGPILAAAFSADGVLCATGGDDRGLCLWKTATGALVHRVSNAHRGPVTSLALFSPDGKMVLTAAGENRTQLWTNPAGMTRGRATELRQYVWNDGASTCVAFDPQGQFAVTGTRDRSVLVWALPPATEVKEP